MIFHVGDKNVILLGSCHPPGRLEKAIGSTFTAKFSNESAVAIKDLNSIIPIITDDNPSFAVDGNICRAVELAFALSVRTKLGNILSPGTKDLNAVVVTVGNVDVTLVVYRNPERGFELALLAAILAKPKKRRANIRVFAPVNNDHSEGAAHDWLILNGNRHFMFAIHLWHVRHNICPVP